MDAQDGDHSRMGANSAGLPPFLSIEITKECPLKCPGCYAYEPGHLNDGRSIGL